MFHRNYRLRSRLLHEKVFGLSRFLIPTYVQSLIKIGSTRLDQAYIYSMGSEMPLSACCIYLHVTIIPFLRIFHMFRLYKIIGNKDYH